MGYKLLICASVLSTAAGVQAIAADGPPAAILAGSCASCHGPAGRSPGDIPPLAGLEAAGIAELMKGFKSGALEATVMNRIAKGFTEEEIVVLADYIANLNP